jgi:hypothetical protein
MDHRFRNLIEGNPATPRPSTRHRRSSKPMTERRRSDAGRLVPDDLIFIRAFIGTPAAAGLPVEQTFRTAFMDVWHRIPRPHRDRLLDYWRRPAKGAVPVQKAAPGVQRPVFEIVEDKAWSFLSAASDRLGTLIRVPLSLITSRPHDLTWAIAGALAQVLRYETREHWGMYVITVEEPLIAWEREQTGRITESRRNRKLDALEREYLRRLGTRMREMVKEWGFDVPDEATWW